MVGRPLAVVPPPGGNSASVIGHRRLMDSFPKIVGTLSKRNGPSKLLCHPPTAASTITPAAARTHRRRPPAGKAETPAGVSAGSELPPGDVITRRFYARLPNSSTVRSPYGVYSYRSIGSPSLSTKPITLTFALCKGFGSEWAAPQQAEVVRRLPQPRISSCDPAGGVVGRC